MKAIVNARIVTEGRIIEDHALLFDEKIEGVVPLPLGVNDVEIIDAEGAYVSAGFIDLHIHGSGGADVMDATPEALEQLSATLLRSGTTGFLATTMTMSEEEIVAALENVWKYGGSVSGAQILGVHLEGPFINPDRHGAQDRRYVRKPDMDLIAPYMEMIKMITLAPEVEGAKQFIADMRSTYPEVILSIGHSDASFEIAQQSFEWGISHATHLFNAMNPLHHRAPGIVGAVFESDVSCDIIADLVHLHPALLSLVYRMKRERLVLITDAMRAGCMKCGSYDLGGRSVEVSKGKALLSDGTLAGSVLKINEALANMVRHTAMTCTEAVDAVTRLPARMLGLKKGQLRQGYDADIVIFDEDFGIISTIVGGTIKYKKEV